MTTTDSRTRGASYRAWLANRPQPRPTRTRDRWWPVVTICILAAGAVIVAAGLHLWAIIGWAIR